MDHQSLLLLIFKGWLVLLIVAYLIKISISQAKRYQTKELLSTPQLVEVHAHLLMSLSLMLPVLVYGANLVFAMSGSSKVDSETFTITNSTLISSSITQLFMTAVCVFAFVTAHKIPVIDAFFPRQEIALPKWLFVAIPIASIALILAIQGTLEQAGLFFWLEQTFNAPLNQTTIEWLQNNELSLATLILLIIQVCLIAPITEEIIFRGIFFKQLENHFGLVIGCLMSAVFFALIHAHLIAFVPLFLFAIILNLSFYYTKNLKIPIITHMIFNSMTIVYQLNFVE